MIEDDEPEDPSWLWDHDWLELNKLLHAYKDGGDEAVKKAFRDLLEKDAPGVEMGRYGNANGVILELAGVQLGLALGVGSAGMTITLPLAIACSKEPARRSAD